MAKIKDQQPITKQLSFEDQKFFAGMTQYLTNCCFHLKFTGISETGLLDPERFLNSLNAAEQNIKEMKEKLNSL